MSQPPAADSLTYENDRELLEGCRRGERDAWSQVLKQYERLVYSIPLNYGLTTADAADIAQQTFTAFLNSLQDLDDDSNLGAWLATVARRQSWRLMDRSKRERVGRSENVGEQLFRLPDRRSRRDMERAEQLQWLNQGLNGLDDRCRRLLLALYFSPQQPSYAEVAEQLDMAEGSIGPTRARCLERLKGLLEALQ